MTRFENWNQEFIRIVCDKKHFATVEMTVILKTKMNFYTMSNSFIFKLFNPISRSPFLPDNAIAKMCRLLQQTFAYGRFFPLKEEMKH